MEDSKEKIIIFSDLDGTLLDHSNYSYKDACSALTKISEKKLPLILISSKTSAEMLEIIHQLKKDGLNIMHPFVCENGSAIYMPKDYFNFSLHNVVDYQIINKNDYEIIQISNTKYKELIKNLKQVEEIIDGKIIGFNDLSEIELSNECGLSLEGAKLSKIREFDEPFRIEPDEPELYKQVERKILEMGLNYTKGGRYAHIMGRQDKGLAVKILDELYKKQFNSIKTIGFGDAKNDLKFLEFCDEGYLVANPKKPLDARIESDKIKKIPEIGPKGFNKIVLELLE